MYALWAWSSPVKRQNWTWFIRSFQVLANHKIKSKEAGESQKCAECQTDYEDWWRLSALLKISSSILEYLFFTHKKVHWVHPSVWTEDILSLNCKSVLKNYTVQQNTTTDIQQGCLSALCRAHLWMTLTALLTTRYWQINLVILSYNLSIVKLNDTRFYQVIQS